MLALIAEDEFLTLMVAQDAVAQLGYAVVVVSSGEDALAISEANERVDLLFTDIGLSDGLSGWAVGRAVASAHPGVAVIYTSGQATTSDYDHHAVERSIWLPKPYSVTGLRNAIARVNALRDRQRPAIP